MCILQEFCLESGMMINRSKTKFMVINGTRCDELPLVSGSLIIVDACDSYTYVGSIFTQDGNIGTSLKLHLAAKQAHVMKFISFVSKNVDLPF